MPRAAFTCKQLLEQLKARAVPERLAGMARYGIDTSKTLGVTMPEIRAIGKATLHDHELAQELWDSGFHEARILASLVDKPQWVTRPQCENWADDFASWDVVDQVCGNLFEKTEFAEQLIREWSKRDEEFIKRAAFALMAWTAVHQKQKDDADFLLWLPIIERESIDGRNFVRKAVNWALRQIGKRSAFLHGPALVLAQRLASSEDKSAAWIGKDAVKELDSEKMRQRLGLM